MKELLNKVAELSSKITTEVSLSSRHQELANAHLKAMIGYRSLGNVAKAAEVRELALSHYELALDHGMSAGSFDHELLTMQRSGLR